jgi:uncharacterized protein YqhQ
MPERLPTYGGQAVIEGVMMRGAQNVAIAVRAPDQQIVIHTEELPPVYRSRWSKTPFLRGLVLLWDALSLGIRALTISANVQTGEDEKLEGPKLYLTLGISLALGIGLFFLLPAVVGYAIERWIIPLFASETGTGASSHLLAALSANPVASAAYSTNAAAWWGNLAEGILRLGLLIGYIVLIGRLAEIQRVFAYHGAEHKTINAFEGGAELTPDVVSQYPLEHPRCGTSFLLTVVVFSVLLFSILGPLPFFWRLASRILLLPFLAAIAYEYIRWIAGHLHLPVVRWLIKPNLALQRLTTREPSKEMLEVSITAFQAMRTKEGV